MRRWNGPRAISRHDHLTFTIELGNVMRHHFLFALAVGLAAQAQAETTPQAGAADIPGEIAAAAAPAIAPTGVNLSVAAATASYDGHGAASGSDEGWEVAVVPYLWASGMTVDVSTPQGEDIKVEESFTDILGILKFAFMGAVDARKGRFVTLHDLIYLSTESKTSGSIGPGLVEAEVDMKTLSMTHLAGYRVVDKGPLFFDVMAGARITHLKAELELSGPLLSIERESSETKVSPVIASRFRLPLGEKWGFGLYGDLGGFGITADISWQLMGTVQYDLNDHWRMLAGWRHFEAHQDESGFDLDLAIDGPFLTAAYRF